jgi:myo-inositol-1(or 4)-monophosphatase
MALKSANINVMQNAVRKAGRALVRDFGELENLQVSRKGPGDFVTAADVRTDKLLRGELGRARPDFGFLTEEEGATEGRDARRRWIIDPIDGTTNFMHGIPHFAISVALQEGRNIVAGMIYQPITDDLYWAERGNGAWLNDRRLRVSARNHLEDSVIGTGIPHMGRPENPRYLNELKVIMGQCSGIRRMGAASLDLAYVAAGRFDGFWERGLSIWDIAAGVLLVREAGGVVSRTDGGSDPEEAGDVLASNDGLHGRLLRALREVRKA